MPRLIYVIGHSGRDTQLIEDCIAWYTSPLHGGFEVMIASDLPEEELDDVYGTFKVPVFSVASLVRFDASEGHGYWQHSLVTALNLRLRALAMAFAATEDGGDDDDTVLVGTDRARILDPADKLLNELAGTGFARAVLMPCSYQTMAPRSLRGDAMLMIRRKAFRKVQETLPRYTHQWLSNRLQSVRDLLDGAMQYSELALRVPLIRCQYLINSVELPEGPDETVQKLNPAMVSSLLRG